MRFCLCKTKYQIKFYVFTVLYIQYVSSFCRISDRLYSIFEIDINLCRANTKRLVTPFDVHATLQDVLRYSGARLGHTDNRAISLFSLVGPARVVVMEGVVWEWCGSGVGVVWVWCGSGVGVVWEWCESGVGVVWEWCGSGVEVVWEWCGSNCYIYVIHTNISCICLTVAEFKYVHIYSILNTYEWKHLCSPPIFCQIPGSRSCSDAFIEPHWCTCLTWEPVPVTGERVRQAGKALVHYINSHTARHRGLCSQLTLQAITWSAILLPNAGKVN